MSIPRKFLTWDERLTLNCFQNVLQLHLVGSGGGGDEVGEDPAHLPQAHLGGRLLHDLVVGVWQDPQGVLATFLQQLIFVCFCFRFVIPGAARRSHTQLP